MHAGVTMRHSLATFVLLLPQVAGAPVGKSLANEKSDSEFMRNMRTMRKNKRKFGNSGLDEK